MEEVRQSDIQRRNYPHIALERREEEDLPRPRATGRRSAGVRSRHSRGPSHVEAPNPTYRNVDHRWNRIAPPASAWLLQATKTSQGRGYKQRPKGLSCHAQSSCNSLPRQRIAAWFAGEVGVPVRSGISVPRINANVWLNSVHLDALTYSPDQRHTRLLPRSHASCRQCS